MFWVGITDECPVLEMHILSIFLIKSDLKLCIHLMPRSHANLHTVYNYYIYL